MVKKEIDSIYLKEISQLDLRGIKFVNLNNNIVPTIWTNTFFWWISERIKLLLYISKLIAEKKEKSAKEIIFYLEKSEWKRVELLNILNKEIEREPNLIKYIKKEEIPYVIKELEKEDVDDPYLIIDKDWNRKNLIYDFIEKVSKKTNFIFSSKVPRTIGNNLTKLKKWLIDNDVTLEDLEWYYDNVYTSFVYNWLQHKSINYFLVEAQDYFYNKEEYQKIIKAIVSYFNEKKLTKNKLAIWNEFQNNKQVVKSILENINWDLDIFNLIIKDYWKYAKWNWLNWTLNTIFKNLYSKYGKYIKEQNLEVETNVEYEKEFLNFINNNNIEDKDIITQFYQVYKKEWIKWIKSLI